MDMPLPVFFKTAQNIPCGISRLMQYTIKVIFIKGYSMLHSLAVGN